MKIRFLGPGILKTEVDGRLRIAYAGDTAEVSAERGVLLVARGMATDKLLERVDAGYDSLHPRPSKLDREDTLRIHAAAHEQTESIARSRRMHPHTVVGAEMTAVPVSAKEE